MSTLTTEWTTLATADGPMRVYTARPEQPSGKAVIVLQEAFGVNDHIQDITRRFAEHGHLALAPELFHRTGAPVLAYEDHADAMALISELGPDQIITDVRAVVDHLGLPPADVAVIGFCFGGRAAFTAATALPGLGAAVVFYGPGIAAGPHAVLDRAGQITAPLLLHVGSADPSIPADQVEAIDKTLTTAGTDFQQYLYPGAGHAFACDARPQRFHEPAAEQAWRRTFDFLDRRLDGRR